LVDYVDRKEVERKELVSTWNTAIVDQASEEGEICVGEDGSVYVSRGEGYYDRLKPITADRVRRDPAWILPQIKRNRTDDLPIFVNQEVFRAIVVNFIDDEWQTPSEQLVSTTKKLLLKAMEKALSDSTELPHYPGLHGVLQHRLTDVISSIERKAKEQVMHFIEKERLPYTQDHYLQENLAKLKFAQIIQQLEVALGLNSGTGSMDSMMSKKSTKAIVAAVVKQNQEKSMDEHMAEDMQHALDAYGKVALKRFIDGVPMQCWNMFRTFPLEAENVFLDFGDDDLRRHVVARDDVRRKVQALEAEEKELKAGLAILESLY
jgi:Dynamin central region